jgi:Sigma-70, region 4
MSIVRADSNDPLAGKTPGCPTDFWELRPPISVEVLGKKEPSKMAVPRGECENRRAVLALRGYSKTIDIPAGLRDQSLEAWRMSVRLSGVLRRAGVRVLGDLQGRNVSDFARERNCGAKTLHELDSLARSAQSGAEKVPSQESAPLPQNGAGFAIPEAICQLQFHELPITGRLANIARSIGARTLGDLKGRSPFELLQYKNCGKRTLGEIQQLIERAISGEFDEPQIEDSTAAVELLTLLEQGIAKLSPREKQFLLLRIGGDDLPCLSFAEIGRRCALTRARVHQIVAKALDTLRKNWGPRVPRLLEMIKRRCLSMGCPLTPALLEKWLRESSRNFRLPRKAQVRLIAALDKNIVCALEKDEGAERIGPADAGLSPAGNRRVSSTPARAAHCSRI